MLLGNVLVNNKKITYYNAAVDYFDILRFNTRTADILRAQIIERIKERRCFFGVPRYMFLSYKHMFAFVFREPKRSDLVFPLKFIDVYRSADYY